MKIIQSLLVLLCFFSPTTMANELSDETTKEMPNFQHKDWELACDNTGTCRAAGYNPESEYEYLVSVMLTRKAGNKQKISAEIQFSTIAYDGRNTCPREVYFGINRKGQGHIRLSKACTGKLNKKQTQALLNALKKVSVIKFGTKKDTFTLSDKGATAVLLKMDEYQKRIGKPSALIKKGKSKEAVLQPKAKPIITIPVMPKAKKHLTFGLLKSNLKKQLNTIPCDFVEKNTDIWAYDLNDKKSLLQIPCMMAAYNYSDYYVVVDKQLNEVQASVGEGNGYENGIISGHWKGRGIGDCWYTTEYAWSGKKFVLSQDSYTGMCRGFPGGAWDLPSYVSEIKRLK
ncbi:MULTISPECIES: DUF1176 domain-containing protein [Pasteurellaceae]|uniref:DUF1176 domain-containing protein n=1 Tax=Pasteurella atlantica TaxID=2827233 RepID=A0AAW8CMD6_9PAST|nr:DUF1176 domain-containing protein [Pasteurella atlantica]MBR0573193.1 DUF1176 domain-containing protein [Pasteurella atlantica]MDP8039191.1 DUF1176 domain-containing protein [Pasteurella atlantica]MDP8041210.1 DUF1176 domain-containing protein [Pasteurella atlantica]MDP8043347.1 DUF1176 domain-containing protein [Pasteurella atlantica]MDP8045433.1 DUF1176 domain-containing protein [Pasteurella atlantica]